MFVVFTPLIGLKRIIYGGGGVTLAGGKYLLNAFSSSSHVAMLSDIIVSN